MDDCVYVLSWFAIKIEATRLVVLLARQSYRILRLKKGSKGDKTELIAG
jgi:hypothetical protein